jgi:hypothetical protein
MSDVDIVIAFLLIEIIIPYLWALYVWLKKI